MKPKSHKPIDTLKERLVEISYLASISAVLAWDQEVHMPEKGADARASSRPRLSPILHQKSALIDAYEPGLTAKDASLIFDDLKNFLIPLLKQISETRVKIDRTRTLGTFPLDRQVAFNKMVAEKMGFDMKSGRLDPSTHPFTTTFHTNDVRITTRYRENDVLYSLGSTIH